MTATDGMPEGSRYVRCIQSSKRVHWDIDEDVIRGRRFRRRRQIPAGRAVAGRRVHDIVA